MRYVTRLGVNILILGGIIFSISIFAIYSSNRNNTLHLELDHAKSAAIALSVNIEQLLLEKVNTTQTLSIMPILKEALEESNRSYSQLSEAGRDEEIYLQNERWKAINDENDAFILEFTDNEAAHLLKEQQANIEGEYGEIFLTNKYGALVASTAKLTTFAHGQKYWWQGAFNNGEGAVFFDDRGYDDSADGYVLGLVVPVKQGDEIIGILKANLNIMGSIYPLIENLQTGHGIEYKLVRSGGGIVFEKGSEPLENRVPDVIFEELQHGDDQPFEFKDLENEWLIGMSEVGITSAMEGFDFGGTFESIDHIKGNTGETWYIVAYHPMNLFLSSLKELTLTLLYSGILLVILLTLAAFIVGNQTVKPLQELIDQSKKVSEGNFSSRVNITRKDEIGNLGDAFNNMTEELEKTTTSIARLESEIVERKQVEGYLRKSEEKYHKLFTQIADPIFVFDKERHHFVDCNQSALDRYGYTLEELRDMSPQQLHPQEEHAEVENNINDEKDSKANTYTHLTKRGGIIQVEITTMPVEYEGQEAWLSIVRDITERVRAEEDKRQLEIHLRQQQKLESIGTLASGVAHEINNPITGIMNYAQLIHDRIDPAEERLREFSSGIIVETKRIATIVKNLLTFSQQGKPVFNPAQMADIMDNTLSLIRTGFRSDQITLEMDMPDNLPQIKCRSQQIQQVLMNLLTNARDSLNERYPEYNADKVINVSVHPFEKDGRRWLRTTIEDHGVGIPEEIRERLFDPFFTTKDRAKETGLGLSISLGIVQDHHGELTYESIENKYTRFHLDLPIDNDQEISQDG